MERAGKVLAKLKLSDAISPDQLAFAAWPVAVGKRIAGHAYPKALVRGALILEAEDAIWQKQLFHLRYDILAKLIEILGAGIVTDLEFRIAGATPRRPPQSAQSHGEIVTSVTVAHNAAGRDGSIPNASASRAMPSPDEADCIKDPVMRILYKQARTRAKKATA